MISHQYQKLLQQDHAANPRWGSTGARYADYLKAMCDHYATQDMLDYGCGKGRLADAMEFEVQRYDPGIPEWSGSPRPADFVVSTDVMEHIEPAYVDEVIEHIRSLTKITGFHAIALRKAAHILPNGKNAHLSVHSANWWLSKFERYGFDTYEVFLPCNGPRYREVMLTFQCWPRGLEHPCPKFCLGASIEH